MSLLPIEHRQGAFANTQILLTDLDDTITTHGLLSDTVYQSLWSLHRAGVKVIVVTGACAGWCDHLARSWPVTGVIGENGAFYFSREGDVADHGSLERTYWSSLEQLQADQRDLYAKFAAHFDDFDSYLTHDQHYRLAEVAVNVSQDLSEPALERKARVLAFCQQENIPHSVSSIHINAWVSDHSKRQMCERIVQRYLGKSLGELPEQVVYAGDSLNDEEMFSVLNLSVGVANIAAVKDQMTHLPTYITPAAYGAGFEQIAEAIISDVAC
ncbi:HAD-IIB family hydrolase [Leucothrix sargassi]|nr:HAD-IIB family hydrolase [Leucothrix sargassi]